LLHEWLVALLSSDNEVIFEDQDPEGFNLIQKISEFMTMDEDAHHILLTAVMENMCSASNNEALNDNKCQQGKEFASLLLEQMRANCMTILEKGKGACFSPRMLWLALSVYTRLKVGYEELRQSSIEVFPSQSTLDRLKSKCAHLMTSVQPFINVFLMIVSNIFWNPRELDMSCAMKCN